MTTNSRKQLLGGFGDRPPAAIASTRHLGRFVLIAIGIAVGMLLQARGSSPTPLASRVPLYCALIAVELALVWFVAIGIHAKGYKLVDLCGRRWRTLFGGIIDVILAIGAAALLRLASPLLFYLFGRWPSNTGFLLPKSASESFVWIAVALCAGICEELVYRGYLQRQLWSLTSSLPAALILQSVIFGCGHIYQGWRPAIVTAIYGLVFGLVAAWRRSIIPGALAHTIVDVIGGLKL
ncbi:MAG TPA: type II CAAX endopeptidase family protein [Chthoniobacterales bacterium]|nr:type II CAAX endopeptidase family protein [Chthoniobacterales bacterium]